MLQPISWILALLLFVGTGVVRANERSDARDQVDFGIEVARRGLWKEAIYRWYRAIDLDPTYAAAWNNLAIALEQEGQLEEALEAYENALDLEPNHLGIEQNYDLFLEAYDRVNQNSR